MRIAGISVNNGHNFRSLASGRAGSTINERSTGFNDNLTTSRSSNNRYLEADRIGFVHCRPMPDWSTSVLSPVLPNYLPWAAVSRLVVASEARVSGPAPLPLLQLLSVSDEPKHAHASIDGLGLKRLWIDAGRASAPISPERQR